MVSNVKQANQAGLVHADMYKATSKDLQGQAIHGTAPGCQDTGAMQTTSRTWPAELQGAIAASLTGSGRSWII